MYLKFFILFLCLTYIKSIEILVEYDEVNDLIFYKSKIYQNGIHQINKIENKNNDAENEISPTLFYIYISIIIGIIKFI